MTDDDPDAIEQTMVSRRLPAAAGRTSSLDIGYFLAVPDGGGLRRVAVGAGGVVIGRQPPAEVVVADPEISRRHCRVEVERGAARITDLGSTNGTFVGGRRIDRTATIRNGGAFVVGGATIRFERRDRREVAEEAALAAEIRRAADYVRAVLPQPLADGPVQTDWWFVPSAALGGDAFGYQYLDADTFCGFVLDVSGHGIGSAMHAVTVANAIRRRTLPDVDFADPAQVAAGLNAAFPMEEHNGLMLTLWYFVYHVGERLLRFCAAGHHPSFMVAGEHSDPAPLWVRAPTIGMLPRGIWAVGRTHVPPGSRLYVFSDGAFEILAANGQPWVIDDLRRIMRGPALADHAEAERIYDAVRAAARPGPLDDDFSVLVMRFS